MPHITAHEVGIAFPLYHVGGRSLKARLLAARGRQLRQVPGRRVSVAALTGLSFHIGAGERVALVGRNGAGKTTLLRALAGVYEPVAGRLEIAGRVGSLIDPSAGIDVEASGRRNILLRGLFMGLPPREAEALAEEVGAFSGLGAFLELPMRTYSAGMQVRLAFSMATLMRPDILLMDEWIAAGDAEFMARAQERLASLVDRAEILVLASHSEAIIRAWCTRAILLEEGQILADGPVAEVLERRAAQLP